MELWKPMCGLALNGREPWRWTSTRFMEWQREQYPPGLVASFDDVIKLSDELDAAAPEIIKTSRDSVQMEI